MIDKPLIDKEQIKEEIKRVKPEDVERMYEIFKEQVLDHPERYQPFLRFVKREQQKAVMFWRKLWHRE